MKTRQMLFLIAFSLSAINLNAQNANLGTGAGSAGGTNNANIGYQSHYSSPQENLRPTTGNAFLGYQAGKVNSGNYNTLIGYQAGYSPSNILSGSNNVFIGSNVGAGVTTESNKLMIDNNATTTPTIYGDFSSKKIGIGGFSSFPSTAGGVNVTGYKLFVKGGILTEEVRINLSTNWADYVFANDYQLPSLEDVECQIKTNGHLFNVPSAKEVKEDGIELGQMAKIQQEKIEELTLYIIDQYKLNQKQSNELIELRALVAQSAVEIAALKAKQTSTNETVQK